MVSVASLGPSAEKIGFLMNTEIEISNGVWAAKKKRTFTIKSGRNRFTVTLELDISFSAFRVDGTALNKAEILLNPDEFPCFSSALRQHRISFPTNYSQRLTMNPGIYSVQLESREPPEEFAERLAYALHVIDGTGKEEMDAV